MDAAQGGFIACTPAMKVAQIAPLYETVPPKFYGGTERVVAHLCDALVDLGHDVTLFAASDSQTQADLIPTRQQAIRLDATPLKSELAAHLIMLDGVKRLAWQFDILHFHVDLLHLPIFEQHAHKTVTTLHGRLDLEDLPAVYERWRRYGLVSISNHQRRPLLNASWLATIGHGIPKSQYPLREHPRGDYLAFLGRIAPEKRPDIAVRLACRAGIPLKIAAKVDSGDAAYFDSIMKPLLNSTTLVDFVGEIDERHKSDFLGNALALLFPIDWPEPFGLVMIEAIACGTPVIAWNCGSVPEVIDDGVSGFIVNSEEEALAAIAHASELDRRKVRAVFDRRFTTPVMARAYVNVYRRLLEGRASVRALEKTSTGVREE